MSLLCTPGGRLPSSSFLRIGDRLVDLRRVIKVEKSRTIWSKKKVLYVHEYKERIDFMFAFGPFIKTFSEEIRLHKMTYDDDEKVYDAHHELLERYVSRNVTNIEDILRNERNVYEEEEEEEKDVDKRLNDRPFERVE